MWSMTSTGGFFSAVQHRNDPNLLMVRCRAEADAKYIAKKTHSVLIRSNGHADYEFRVVMTKARYAAFMVNEVMAIDYDNFKNSVKKRQGAARASAYMSVWSALLRLQPVAPYAATRSFWSGRGSATTTPSRPTAGASAGWPDSGTRGGRQEHWWDDLPATPQFSSRLEEDEGGLARLESEADEQGYWDCRTCGKDIADCTCFSDSAEQSSQTASARRRTRQRQQRKQNKQKKGSHRR